MKVVFIGTGCGVPSKRRAPPALIIKAKGRPLLFDTGVGTLRGMFKAGIEGNEITHIFYTHLHVDHTGDLAAILFAAKNPLDLRQQDLVLVGPKGLRDFYHRLLNLYGDQLISSCYNLVIDEIEEGECQYEGCRIGVKPLLHTPQSIGYRVEDDEGKVVVYSGDTDYCQGIVLLARGADLLILESSFPDEAKVSGHLTPSLAGRIAQESGCRRLVLTHLYPVCDDYDVLGKAGKVFGGELTLAEDLMEIEV